MKRITAYLFCIFFFVLAQSQDQTTRILFVFDASNSMNGFWNGKPKIQTATALLKESLKELEYKKNVELGLRVYGNNAPISAGNQDCEDTELMVPIGKSNVWDIQQALKKIRPKGTTPIAQTLEKCGSDFREADNTRNIIILITDGIEACDGDPCAVSLALQKKNIVLKPFVIGIGIEDYTSFECVGNFYDASDEKTFEKVLDIVISQALNNTTAQVNLLNINDKPLETNVPMTFYDSKTGQILYNFVHTLNHKGNPDTIPIDPVHNYDLKIHTIPSVEIKDIQLTPGIHNYISASTPQGDLEFKMSGRNSYKDLKVLLRKKGEPEVIHVQNFDQIERLIVGEYDLEILTLPRTRIEKSSIAQSHTTSIEIPHPGVVNVSIAKQGYGSIFLLNGDDMEWVCNLDATESRQTVTLQPGFYKVVFRSKTSKQSIYTLEEEFQIKSGISTTLKI
ncbi:MAG: VWA domain-containing protein [Bacteroidota bacterium]